MTNSEAARTESTCAIEAVYLHTRGVIRLASDLRHRQQIASSRLAVLQADAPPSAARDSGRRAVAALLPVILVAVFVVEWLLAAPTAEWFAVTLLGSPEWAPTLTWLLPTSVFLVEILVAIQLTDEWERRRDGQRTLRATGLAAVLLVVMPLFSLATQLAVLPDDPQLLPMYWTRTAGLVLLALVLHGTVLVSGRLIRESLGWWSFVMAGGSWRAGMWVLRRREQRATAAALKGVTIYRRLHGVHRQMWPADVLEFGPWDGAARLVVGEELSRAPDVTQEAERSQALDPRSAAWTS
jgi:hypothetical protein